jgi:hypothetical protein
MCWSLRLRRHYMQAKRLAASRTGKAYGRLKSN